MIKKAEILAAYICPNCAQAIALTRLTRREREALHTREGELRCLECRIPFEARLAIPQDREFPKP